MPIPAVDIGWTTTKSGVSSPYGWNISNGGRTIRFDIQNSANCGGPNNNTQSGVANASLTPNANYELNVGLSGIGELQDAGYENMTLKLNGTTIITATSKNQNQGCNSGAVAVSVKVPGPYSLPKNATAAFSLTFTTADPLFHVNCYYQCDLSFTLLDPPTIVEFNANKTAITVGENVTLSWIADYANTASLNQGIGGVPTSGAVVVSPTTTTTYTLTATNDKGNVTKNVTVTVYPKPVIDSFTISNSSPLSGDSVTISWTTTGVTDLTLSGSQGAFNGSSPSNLLADGSFTFIAGAGGYYTAKLTGFNPLNVKDEETLSFTVRDETPNPFEFATSDSNQPNEQRESNTVTINGFSPTQYTDNKLPIKSNYPIQIMINGDGVWRDVQQI